MTSISSKIFWKTPGNDNVGNKKVTGTEKYEIIKEIGQGSYGIVYKARNRITKELCAIKKISLGKCKLDKAQEEADKLKNLEKIGIPDTILKYYDAYIDESNFYIVTEFCENGDLNDVIHKNLHISLDEKMIWNYFLEICIALYFLHKNRILHRDIKPLNVYLVPGNHIKLGDFGLAKTLKDTDYTTTFVGTPLYVCPEIIRHLQYNNKADIWSLGVMLYEMVTKTWPFMSYDQYEILTKILKESYKPLPESVSLEIKDLVNRCLQKDPSKRPPIQEILIMPNVRKWAKELKIKNFPSLDSLVDELAKNRALPLEYQHLLKPKINPIKGEEEKKKDSDFEEFDFECIFINILRKL